MRRANDIKGNNRRIDHCSGLYTGRQSCTVSVLSKVFADFICNMIKIFQKLNEFRFEGSLEGWLKRVCVNQCLDALKKSKAKFHESLSDVHSNLPSESNIISDINVKNLMQLLSKLPVGYRTVFNLFAIEGYSHAEIASLLNITENTSKSQMFKARKWLQSQIIK